MNLKKHIDNVEAAEKELAALTKPTSLQRDALIRARIFKRVLAQCVAEEEEGKKVVAEANLQIDAINAAAQPSSPDPRRSTPK